NCTRRRGSLLAPTACHALCTPLARHLDEQHDRAVCATACSSAWAARGGHRRPTSARRRRRLVHHPMGSKRLDRRHLRPCLATAGMVVVLESVTCTGRWFAERGSLASRGRVIRFVLVLECVQQIQWIFVW